MKKQTTNPLPGQTINKMIENKGYWNSRLMIGTPTTGLVRMEWASARFGQVIPTNWSQSNAIPYMPSLAPLNFLVPDAQNIIVREAINKKVEWLLLVEQDNVLPPDAFLRFNDYMRKATIPVVSGLYFTKSVPPEPMIYRGDGQSFYIDWKMGEKVWCSGVPTGCLLIHCSILQKMWDESPEYTISGEVVRRVFDAPAKLWYDPKQQGYRSEMGTSDLFWCKRVITENFFAKAGWKKIQAKEYQFLVDTGIYCTHIDNNGTTWPISIPKEYLPTNKPKSKV